MNFEKFWFEEWTKERLEATFTHNLLKLRDALYAYGYDNIYHSEISVERAEEAEQNLENFRKNLYEILGTREHVPNKEERKAIRIRKAYKRKYGQ